MKTLELNQMEVLEGGWGSWRECFSDAAGSAEGIGLAVTAGFFGPAGVAGVYIGFGIGCLIATY
ncbi:MAG: hypothetical protein COB01_05265 [Lutibacter sp.]|nr:MAG: hypothetical protein COB01_10690 [Lutibacter sp.]PHS53348.1 MAG: hypothetical protein COB01_05265 [Lutibacter sp.]